MSCLSWKANVLSGFSGQLLITSRECTLDFQVTSSD